MPYYQLVAPTSRSDVLVDELILARDEDTNQPSVVISKTGANELSDEYLGQAQALAARIGYEVVEVEAPEEDENSQETTAGDDVKGQIEVGTGESANTPDQTTGATTESVSGTASSIVRPAPSTTTP